MAEDRQQKAKKLNTIKGGLTVVKLGGNMETNQTVILTLPEVTERGLDILLNRPLLMR